MLGALPWAIRQGYFAERGTQNGIVLNMQIKRDNNLALFSNPLITVPFCILPYAKYHCPWAIDCRQGRQNHSHMAILAKLDRD